MAQVEDEVIEAAQKVAGREACDAAVLLAVALVETNGVAFAAFAGRREPLIRFEGHYFDRLLSAAEKIEARRQGLADPRAGRIRNPAAQSARWALFDRAARIDPAAAAASVSWGLCQVMGAHWQRLGYGDAEALGKAARLSAEGQFEVAARFLNLGGLSARLSRGDTAGFARGYNGAAYRTNRYDEKIGAAYETAKWLLRSRRAGDDAGGSASPSRVVPPIARTATLVTRKQPEAVRALQAALRKAGLVVAVDGLLGPRTVAAVRDFQQKAGLAVDGLAGRRTLKALGLLD